jgi:hypothetical protein
MPNPNIPELVKSPYPATHIVDANGDIVSSFSGGSGGGGAGISQAQVQAAIEAATNLANILAKLEQIRTHVDGIDGIETLLADLSGFVTFPDTTPIPIGGTTPAHSFEGFRICVATVTVAGIGAGETATVQIEHQPSASAPYDIVGSAEALPVGVYSLNFAGFTAHNLRLKLVSSANSAATISSVYWRFSR